MASYSRIKKGFTLVEATVVIFIFTTLMVIASQIYLNIAKNIVNIQNFQLSLDNVRFGAEKIWNEVKSGSSFTLISNGIEFKNRLCKKVKFYVSGDNILYEIEGTGVPLFDKNLVKLNGFRIFSDEPNRSGNYFNTAYKIFIFEYDVILKSKSGSVPFSFWQTVAPSNSIFLNPPCP